MDTKIYKQRIIIDWSLIQKISQLDRFDAAWASLEKSSKNSLSQLKTIATIRSIGSSTRIEGSQMSNEQVEVLLKNITINKFESRDEQEVAGYREALDIITEDYDGLKISENDIKGLHNILMKYSEKDMWHKGDYKQLSNAVEATMANGDHKIIFKTTEAGYATQDAMRNLVEWYNSEADAHGLVTCAVFTYEFLSIHPFQDGNGRMSRLLSNLLLLKNGYKWIQYVSFEHEIESRKAEYYRVLRLCQAGRPNEDITLWVNFFLDCLVNIQHQLKDKLERNLQSAELSRREQSIVSFVGEHPDCQSGEIIATLEISPATAKRHLTKLVDEGVLIRIGNPRRPKYRVGK